MIDILDRPDSMSKAIALAQAVVAGTIEPGLGCGLIGELAERLQHPPALLDLVHLSHLQHGHEGLGFTTEGCAPEILEACQVLVESQGAAE
jgi:hypothetical protein